ncbi:GNAT family N-acetyltransferase [Tellurirhabdus bombi]|uniref:GNAT family N-acetyltransferase n=1 Tax=Tellurirhabdus bombi TaxID=2907205 RepID=UPI001F2D2C87|nr:GNAT family N-acetyltransferase [Tellurirhabdus bombi]
MLVITQAQTEQDLQGILDLQRRNLRRLIEADTAHSQGFLVSEYDIPFLKKMAEIEPGIIAKDGDTVAGYCLPLHPSLSSESLLLTSMVDTLNRVDFQEKSLSRSNYIVVGQVCVGDGYRSQGLFDQLYQHFKQQLSGRYDLAVAEVAQRNSRSQRAHERVGFQKIHDHFDPMYDETWNVLVWDWH